jgi:protein-glutamine gamma-glutamyltransferase
MKLLSRRSSVPTPSADRGKTVEDSFMLRLLVQLLVCVGIGATDVAASTNHSLWAIPLSLVGGGWSWRARRQSNLPVKLGIALGMLVGLGWFLSRLVAQGEDSRLLLTQLLIQLQVLHSFDLPRRKDLGYSTVIGVILLAVAATLSQTMAFGGFLLLFLAVALPVLVLDYRSRLGLTVPASVSNLRRSQDTGGQLSHLFRHPRKREIGQQFGRQTQAFIALLLAVVALGLVIFLLTPRLPGYQLRMNQAFQPERVINPGYVRTGQPGQSPAGRQQQDQGFAQGQATQVFNSDFYYGFNTEINQNLQGTLTPRVVMRVRSQTAGFWRVLAFDRYTGQGWRSEQRPQILQRDRWSYQFRLPALTPLLHSKEIVQTYTITSEFTNLLPALFQPRELYFPTREVAIDSGGSLRAPVTLSEGMTYTVISDVPYRDRTPLQTTVTTYPRRIREQYLQVPAAIAPQLRTQAEKLLARANRPISTPYEQALFLTQALKQGYSLQPNLPMLDEGEDLATAFLFKFQGGQPDHFATTLTMLLRSLGIPARLVTGFAPGEFNPFTGLYVVKNTDAYALSEVYFPGYGWLAFDPIPGHPLFPPSVETDQTFTAVQQFWNWLAGWLPSSVTGLLAIIGAGLVSLVGRFLGLFSSGLSGLGQAVLLLLGLMVLLWAGQQAWRVWRQQRRWAKLAPPEALYQQMLAWLEQQGMPKHPAQTPLEYLNELQQDNLQQSIPAPWTETIEEISVAYIGWRYGGQTPDLRYLRLLVKRLRQSPIPPWRTAETIRQIRQLRGFRRAR